MDSKTIFTKTAKGLKELEKVGRSRVLSSEFRTILRKIDGKASILQLAGALDDMTEDKLQEPLEKLLARDYIRELVTESDGSMMFTKTVRGLKESIGKTRELPGESRAILKEIDGETPLAQLPGKVDDLPKGKLLEIVNQLLVGDYIRELAIELDPLLDGDLSPVERSPESIPSAAEDIDLSFSSIAAAKEAESKKRAEAEKLVNDYLPLVAGAGLVPIPAIDLMLIASIQLRMLSRLSELYGIPFKEQAARSSIGSLAAIVMQGTLTIGLMSAFKIIPGFGMLVGVTALPAMGAACTYAIGQIFISHFEAGGNFQDFDARKVEAEFRAEFKRAGG